ncbi:MAG: hypothetical protein H3Z54_10015 [archaeon]|nr:hypothetical protein [archaeon]
MAQVEDFEWINEHYAELQKKYPNMYVAVKDGIVLSADKEFDKVYDEAMRKVGRVFVTGYVLSGEPFVLDVKKRNLLTQNTARDAH